MKQSRVKKTNTNFVAVQLLLLILSTKVNEANSVLSEGGPVESTSPKPHVNSEEDKKIIFAIKTLDFGKKERKPDTCTTSDICTSMPGICNKGTCITKQCGDISCNCEAGITGQFCDRNLTDVDNANNAPVVNGKIVSTLSAPTSVSVSQDSSSPTPLPSMHHAATDNSYVTNSDIINDIITTDSFKIKPEEKRRNGYYGSDNAEHEELKNKNKLAKQDGGRNAIGNFNATGNSDIKISNTTTERNWHESSFSDVQNNSFQITTPNMSQDDTKEKQLQVSQEQMVESGSTTPVTTTKIINEKTPHMRRQSLKESRHRKSTQAYIQSESRPKTFNRAKREQKKREQRNANDKNISGVLNQ